MERKKFSIYLAIILVIVLIVGGIVYSVFLKKDREAVQEETELEEARKQEKIIRKQVEELDNLRQQADSQSFSQEEADIQVEELDNLRQQADSQSVSSEDADRQLDELDKLRDQIIK